MIEGDDNMKTSELIEKVNNNTSIIAKLEYGKIAFYCQDNDYYFYGCPVDATALESGKSYIQCIANVSMEDIFRVGIYLTEYLKTPFKDREDIKRYMVWYETISGEYIRVIHRDATENSGFNYYYCKSVDDFICGDDQRFRIVSQLTEKDIMSLPEKFIPKQFGGIGFTECVEVKE